MSDKFSELITSLYTMEFPPYRSEIVDITIDPTTPTSTTYVGRGKLYKDDKLIWDEEIGFNVPKSIGDTVNTGEALRVSITLASKSPTIRQYSKGLSLEKMYISMKDGTVAFEGNEVYIDIKAFLNHYHLLAKYYPGESASSIRALTPEEVDVVNRFEMNGRELAKVSIFYHRSDINPKLCTETLQLLMDLIDNEEFASLPVTPLDFRYMDLSEGMVADIRQSKWKDLRLAIRGQARKYEKLYSSKLQNAINKYFKLQADFFRSLQSPADDNALSIQAQSRTIYFIDPKNQDEGDNKLRVYNDYFIGVLDPIMTTEAAQINKTNRFTNATEISGGILYCKVLDPSFQLRMVPYEEYITKRILALDHVDLEHRTIHPNEDGVYVIYKLGEYYETTKPEFDYMFTRDSMISPNTEVIPFINNTDTTRGMMSGKHSAQSIPVIGAEPQTVYTSGNKDIYNRSSLNVRSKIEGKVIEVLDDKYVKVRSDQGKVEVYSVPHSYTRTNNNTCNHFDRVVNVGDHVKVGDTIFNMNSFIDGEWTTSVPLYCAYTTWHAMEHADGFVISESAAKKLGHRMEEVIEVPLSNELKFDFNTIDMVDVETMQEVIPIIDPGKYDKWNIIKEGSTIHRREPLFRYYEYLPESEDYVRLANTIASKDNSLRYLRTIRVPYQIIEGKVTSVRLYCNDNVAERPQDKELVDHYRKVNSDYENKVKEFGGTVSKDIGYIDQSVKYILVIKIEYINTCKLSDKLANMYGSKGVVTGLLPDDQMPRDENGRVIDIVISPISTPGRKNIGQLYECKLGIVCEESYKILVSALNETNPVIRKSKFELLTKILNLLYKTSKYSDYTEDDWIKEQILNSKYKKFRVKVDAFDDYYTARVVMQLLDYVGIPNGMRRLYDPLSHSWVDDPVEVGLTSIRRLHFIAEFKAMATGRANESDSMVLGYGKVKYNGQKIGEQETWQLLAWSKLHELSDMISENQDKGSSIATGLLALGMKMRRLS